VEVSVQIVSITAALGRRVAEDVIVTRKGGMRRAEK